jgi:hypothetical protein
MNPPTRGFLLSAFAQFTWGVMKDDNKGETMDDTTIHPGDTLTRKCWRTYAVNLARGAGLMTGAILAAAVFKGTPRGPKPENQPTEN